MSQSLLFRFAHLSLWTFVFSTGLAEYDEKVAKQMLLLSAAAYNDKPAACLEGHFRNVEMVMTANVNCGKLFDDDCFGYVALIHGSKRIAVGYRGTTKKYQLITEVASGFGHKKPFLDGMGYVNRYFHHAHKLLWSGLEEALVRTAARYPNYEVWIAGHSLGGALASMTSATVVKKGIVTANRSKHYSFGQPRVGDLAFAAAFRDLIPNYYRVTHADDLVTTLFPLHFGYRHFPNEVWYSGDMTADLTHTICTAFADPECTDEGHRKSVEDHVHYFGVKVSHYGHQNCPKIEMSVSDDETSHGFFASVVSSVVNAFHWLFC